MRLGDWAGTAALQHATVMMGLWSAAQHGRRWTCSRHGAKEHPQRVRIKHCPCGRYLPLLRAFFARGGVRAREVASSYKRCNHLVRGSLLPARVDAARLRSD